jgi:hypothetical protein
MVEDDLYITDVVREVKFESCGDNKYEYSMPLMHGYYYTDITIAPEDDIPRFNKILVYIGDDTIMYMRYDYIRGWTLLNEKIEGGDTRLVIRIFSTENIEKISLYYRQNVVVHPCINT